MMGAIINHAHEEKHGGRRNAVSDHLKHRPVHGPRPILFARGRPHGDAQNDVPHVTDRAVGYQLLEIGLGHGREGAIHDVDDAEQTDPIGEIFCGPRANRISDAQDAVAAHLEQHAGQNHADGRRRLDVGIG